MCRSIQTLRPPYADHVTPADVEAAALQYVRKLSGMRAPAAANREVFDRAVAEVAAATTELLDGLVLRAPRQRPSEPDVDGGPAAVSPAALTEAPRRPSQRHERPARRA